MNEPGVKNVTVRTATFSKTQNGFRVKSWGRPSKGFVNDVHFEHAQMTDVQNPIVIDQNYCPNNKDCPHNVSFSMGYFCFNVPFGPKIKTKLLGHQISRRIKSI